MLDMASCVPLAVTSGGADTSRKFDTGVQKSATWIHPPTTDRTPSTDDRHEHHQRPLAGPSPGPDVVVLTRVGARLAPEDHEQHAERVEAGQERPDHAGDPEDRAEGAVRERRGEDRVLREEAGERRDADERKAADEEEPVGARHQHAHPAHLPHVLLAREGVDQEARREEEQRLEERVGEQVEHPVRVRAHADADEHVADLRHRRVGDHALDVRLHERDEPCDEQRHCAEPGCEVQDVRRELEDACVRAIR